MFMNTGQFKLIADSLDKKMPNDVSVYNPFRCHFDTRQFCLSHFACVSRMRRCQVVGHFYLVYMPREVKDHMQGYMYNLSLYCCCCIVLSRSVARP